DSPPDIRLALIVAVFDRARDERRILVEHIVHAKRDRRVIEPCPPPTWIALRGRDRPNVLVLSIRYFHVRAAIFGISGNFVLRRRSRQAKRVVQNKIQRRPFTNLARLLRADRRLLRILSDVMNDETGIDSAEPRARWAVIEQARIRAVSRVGAKSHSQELAGKINSAFHWAGLRYKPSQVVAIESEHECPEVPMAEEGGIQLIASFVIETFCDIPGRVAQGTVNL